MDTEKISLKDIAYARSGDKGSTANIGVIAYTLEGYLFLEKNLTAVMVRKYFQPLNPTVVKRYRLPNLGALNFILEGVLDGGGSRSLRVDAQGKALGQAILKMPINIPKRILPFCRPKMRNIG